MTIAIGLISKAPERQSIVLACDSQTTYPGGPKALDAQKLSKLHFLNGEVLVAHAGSVDLAARVIQLMQREAGAMEIIDEQTVPDVAAKAIRQIRAHFKSINEGIITSDEGWKRFFLEDAYLELLVGYFFKTKPQLFTMDIDWAIPVPVTQNYKAIGIGKHMGEFFIREYRESDPNFVFAWPESISVIERVIPNVEGCGEPTWVGIVYPMPKESAEQYEARQQSYRISMADIFGQEKIAPIVAELRSIEPKMAEIRKKEINKSLDRVFKKHAAEVQKQMKQSEGSTGTR